MNTLLRKIKTSRQLGGKMMLLLLPTFIFMVIAHLILVFFPFKKVAGLLGTLFKKQEEIIEVEEVKKIGQAISIVSESVPWEAACYVQALTAKLMLRLKKTNCTIYIGVCKDEVSGEFKGHAWVKSGSQFVTGKRGHKKYSIIAFYT